MTGDELARRLERGGVTLVDVRSRVEFDGVAGYPCDPRQGHIPGALHLELDDILDAQRRGPEAVRELLRERGGDPKEPIVAYCHSGRRSGIAATALRTAGLEAENYEGSWHEWSRRDESPG